MLPNGKRGRSRYMGSNMADFEIRGLIKGGGPPPLVRKDVLALVRGPRKHLTAWYYGHSHVLVPRCRYPEVRLVIIKDGPGGGLDAPQWHKGPF